LVWNEEGNTSPYYVMLAEKEAFFNRYHRQVSGATDSHLIEGVEVDAMIKHDQAETRDHGISTFQTYEPGYPTTYTFSFALTGGVGKADPVLAHRFAVPEDAAYVELPKHKRPDKWTESLISVSAPNVVIEVLKPSSIGNSADYILRLQEIAGKATDLSVKSRLPIGSIDETTLTEDRILRSAIDANAIHIAPYQTLTLRLSAVHQAGTASREQH
jgi:hypothetical protein